MATCSGCRKDYGGRANFCPHCAVKQPPLPPEVIQELLNDEAEVLSELNSKNPLERSIDAAFSPVSQCDNMSHVIMAVFDEQLVERGHITQEQLPKFCRKCGAKLLRK